MDFVDDDVTMDFVDDDVALMQVTYIIIQSH